LADGASFRAVYIALAANLVIAAAKLIAGLLSRSSAKLSEAAHSLADSLNEVFLGISLRRAPRSRYDTSVGPRAKLMEQSHRS
jgi:divalent metal cation (Fe/Co/Zn/Cd) transporter